MPDAIESARRMLEARLAEVDSEASKLRSALQGMGGTKQRAVTSTRRRRGDGAGRRARRGQRGKEFLAAVKKSPGASAAELGKQIGISTNQAYALGQRLTKSGEVKKKGKGYIGA